MGSYLVITPGFQCFHPLGPSKKIYLTLLSAKNRCLITNYRLLISPAKPKSADYLHRFAKKVADSGEIGHLLSLLYDYVSS